MSADVELHEAVLSGSASLNASGYDPRRFLETVADVGAVEATRRLVRTSSPSDGVATLREMRKLDMSLQAMALLPWYTCLFTDAEQQNARQRLAAHGCPVDQQLMRAAQVPRPCAGTQAPARPSPPAASSVEETPPRENP